MTQRTNHRQNDTAGQIPGGVVVRLANARISLALVLVLVLVLLITSGGAG